MKRFPTDTQKSMEDLQAKKPDSDEPRSLPDTSLRTALEQEWQPSEVPSDTQCLGFSVFFLVALCAFTGWSYRSGDPQRLVRGWDVYGRFCGQEGREGLTYAVFPAPEEDIRLTLCAIGCPAVTATEAICLYDTSLQPLKDLGCYDAVPSVPYHNRYCLPSTHAPRLRVLSWLMQPGQVMTRVIGDLVRTWDLLAIGALISFTAGCLLLVVSLCGVLCNATLFLVAGGGAIALLGALAFVVFNEAWRVDEMICGGFSVVHMTDCNEGETSTGYRSLAWFVVAMGGCVTVAFFTMLSGFYKGIQLFVTLTRLISPWLVLCPVLGGLVGLGLYAYFLTLSVFAVSTGSRESQQGSHVPLNEFDTWEFSTPERVLMFFLISMALWCFATVGHMVEFVTARCIAMRYINADRDNGLKTLSQATFHMLKFRIGSVQMAALLLPLFRLPRHLLLGMKRARKSFAWEWLCRPLMRECTCFRSCYSRWLKYMTSDGLAWEAIKGGSFVSASVLGHALVKRHKKMQTMEMLNRANYAIWAQQLALTLLGPVFIAYFIAYEKVTLDQMEIREVTSVTGLALLMLGGSWVQAQVLGGFLRGVLHGGLMAFLMDVDMSTNPERPIARDLLAFLNGPLSPAENDLEDGKSSKRYMNKVRPISEVPFPVAEAVGEEEDSVKGVVHTVPPPPPSRPGEATFDIAT